MPRPGFELRELDDEQRRRAQAHRKLRWARRGRLALGAAGGAVLLAILLAALRAVGVSVG